MLSIHVCMYVVCLYITEEAVETVTLIPSFNRPAVPKPMQQRCSGAAGTVRDDGGGGQRQSNSAEVLNGPGWLAGQERTPESG